MAMPTTNGLRCAQRVDGGSWCRTLISAAGAVRISSMRFRSVFTLIFLAALPATAHGVIYSVQDLGDLPGGTDGSSAMDINDLGQVVGYSRTGTGYRAFLWTSGGGMQNLGDLPGGEDYSYAFAINDLGQVVGYSPAATGTHAFLWTSGGGMQDL